MANSNSVTKHRTQVYFPSDLFRKIKRISREKDISIAEIIRRAVIKEIDWQGGRRAGIRGKELAWKKFFAQAGIDKGPKDLSYRHDKYFR